MSPVEVNTAYSDPRQLFWSPCTNIKVLQVKNVSFVSLQQQTSPLKTAANSASAHHSRIQILKANVLLNRSYVCLCLNDPTTALDCAQSLLALSSSPSSPSETGKLLSSSSSGVPIQPEFQSQFQNQFQNQFNKTPYPVSKPI